MRLTFVLAALGIAAFALTALSLGTSAQAKTVEIETGNFYFCAPANQGQSCQTSAEAGDTVTWKNVAGTHQIAQCTDDTFLTCTGGFNTGAFSSGQTKSQTLNSAGDVYYRCDFHPENMKGEIAVVAAATASPSPTTAASQTAATDAPTVTPAKVPATGGLADDGGSNVWEYALLGVGGMFIAGAAALFVYARNRR